jgi:hypothetical protein
MRQKLNEMVTAINATNSMREKAMSGNLVFKVTPATNNETAANQNRGAGVKQKETLTPVLVGDSVVTAGNVKITITDSVVGTVQVTFAVAQSDNQAAVVTKAKTALGAVSSITTNFTIAGTSSTITVEKKVAAANDATFVVKIEPVTTGAELATVISANTTAGVAPYTRSVVITLEDADGNVHDWFNSDITISVAEVTAGNGAIAVADTTPAMVNGRATVTITFSGTFAAADTNTLTVAQATILGYTVAAKTSVQTST